MAKVEIRNVHKSYGPTEVMRDVSVDVPDGAFAVLVGPSGCGKSTLLRMIAGLEDIDSGTISIGGRVINDVEPKHRDIAMVFQNYALYPHMSVAENMGFSLRLARHSKAEIAGKVDEAARILGLSDYLDRLPRQLSGGQRQRVAMGRAIVRDPAVFLFDEPLSNLDAKLRVQMRAELKELHARLGSTTIYVTHDQIEAMTMADVIVAMRGGIVEQTGDPLTLYDRPANMFVAGFIGSPAINFVTGRVDFGRRRTGVPRGGRPVLAGRPRRRARGRRRAGRLRRPARALLARLRRRGSAREADGDRTDRGRDARHRHDRPIARHRRHARADLGPAWRDDPPRGGSRPRASF